MDRAGHGGARRCREVSEWVYSSDNDGNDTLGSWSGLGAIPKDSEIQGDCSEEKGWRKREWSERHGHGVSLSGDRL